MKNGNNKYVKLFISDLFKYKKFHIGGFIFMIFNTALTLLQPTLIMGIIDNAIINSDKSLLIKLSVIYLVVIMIQIITQMLDDYIYALLGQKISLSFKRKILSSIYNKGNKVGLDETGEVLTLVQDDSSVLEEVGTKFLFSVITDVIISIGMFIYLAYIQIDLLLLTIGFQAAIIFFQRYFNNKIRNVSEKLRDSFSNNMSILQEYIFNIKEVVRLDGANYFNKRYTKVEESLRKNNINIQVLISLNGMILMLIGSIITIVVLGIGGYKVINGTLSMGTLIAFNIYCQKLLSPFTRLSQYSSQYNRALISMKRIYDFLENDDYNKITDIQDSNITEFDGNIVFNDVSFKYGEKIVLDKINFEIEANKITTIAGKNGAGKSTILKLILGELKPQEGTIEVNGINHSDISSEQLKKLISIVSQDIILFNDTIYNNITLLDDRYSKQQVYDVMKKINVYEEFMSLPNKLDTQVGENGCNLSGGQRQKIAIIRALIKNTPIIIFDESTSVMDSKSERYFSDLIKEIAKVKTVIMIAHRKETIMVSDVIHFIENGEVLESGTHNCLMKQRNGYYEIFNDNKLDNAV